MRDFPVFTTEYGVGSLVLKEIPYSATAYITIRDSMEPELFLTECTDFCKAVGAKRIYATGHRILEGFACHHTVMAMSAAASGIPDTDACLFPVTEETVSGWQALYNDRMAKVDNAAYMSDRLARQMLKRGDGYFIHSNGLLLGIGMASGDRIDCVATAVPGKGAQVVCALAHALTCERIVLEVASTNHRAIKLYESLGFVPTAEIARWYKIF